MLATITRAYSPELQQCLKNGAELTFSFKGGATTPFTSYALAYGVATLLVTVTSFEQVSIHTASGPIQGYTMVVEYDEDDLPGDLKVVENCAICGIACLDDGCTDPCTTSLPNLALWPVNRSVDPVEDDLGDPIALSFGSGCCYWPENNTVLVVDNATPRILEMGTNGVFRRYIDLTGFDDIEGITPVNSAIGLFAIIEEDLATICRITIPFTGAATIAKGVGYPDVLTTGIPHAANAGLEAVAYDPVNLRYFVLNEKEVAGGWTLFSVTDEAVPTVEGLFSLYSILAGIATDVSDMTTTNAGTFLFASHEGATAADSYGRLIEVSMDGRLIQQTNVPFFLQLEGIDLSPTDHRLFLVGEPNSGSGLQYQEWRRP